MNIIKNNFQAPSWYIFDKIHLGSAKDLLNQASSDGIFIGRYVLVKYCESLLEAEERTLLESFISEAQITDDPTGDKKSYFLNYREDGATYSYDRVVFQKIYKNNKITYHAICNLHQIQNVIIQPGEGGGGTVVNPIRIAMIDPNPPETTDNDILQGIADNNQGDIVIIRRQIANDKYSHTAYVYDNNLGWAAMDGNYSAENVYFDSNLVMTANIGVQSLGTASSKELDTTGKSLKQVLGMILAKEEKPIITSNPSITTYLANNAAPANSDIAVEGGSTITPKWSASFNAGAYSYGPATGITPTAWEVKGYIGSNAVSGHTSTDTSGTFGNVVLAAGQAYKVNAKATYGAGALAYTNLGEEYKAGNALFDKTENAASVQIAAGSKNDDSPKITAWQQGYYIGTLESDVNITSDILRAKDTNKVLKNRMVRGGDYAAVTDLKFSPSGTMAKFVIAYPASKDMTNGAYDSTKGLQSFFNNSSFEEYKGNFTRNVIKVAGADNDLTSSHAIDYAVWTWAPAAAFSGSINFLIDLK